LIEGVPGLAKTRAVRCLARALDLPFRRIQFTPDLLPADLTGTQIYRPASGTFDVRPGPIVTSVLLADEINRAPAKVQSALLEAMQEGQVTVGDETVICRQRSGSWRLRIRSSMRARIHCLKHNSTASS
jgi:MoxR-like ATPase